MHGHARTFSEQVKASIIDDSHCWMSDVAFRTAPTNWRAFLFKSTSEHATHTLFLHRLATIHAVADTRQQRDS